jgi:ZIP family zinc transporter
VESHLSLLLRLLLAAIAFALVPHGSTQLTLVEMIIIFLLGTVVFMAIDMLIAHNHGLGLVLAVFIGLQNLPEGFNSYLELNKRISKSKTLTLLSVLALVDVLAAIAGEFFLSEMPRVIAFIMIFASGGILYLVFQDIAPLSKVRKNWVPATGASFGFILGMLGERLIG